MAFADEGFQFKAQGLALLLVERFIDFGDPLVLQRESITVLVEDFTVFHS